MKVSTAVQVKDLASTCDAHFTFPPDRETDNYENQCYIFKTDYENLFSYTTSAFASTNPKAIATLSLVLYEEDNKQLWYCHEFDNNKCWRLMERPGDWQLVIDKFMLEYKINAMLREST